jgi:hypothetical protein
MTLCMWLIISRKKWITKDNEMTAHRDNCHVCPSQQDVKLVALMEQWPRHTQRILEHLHFENV